MKVINLGSGSKGNATIIKTTKTSILIDAGFTHKQMVIRSHEEINNISNVLITHEHIDHIAGLTVLSKKQHLVIYTHEKIWHAIKDKLNSETEVVYIEGYHDFMIGDIRITPITTSHDSAASLGFVFESEGKKMVYITDTGFVHHDAFQIMSNANLYFLESNHDIEMLMTSDRPYDLKTRIFGDKGHLSNEDASALLCYVLGPNTKDIIFAHISEECNTVEKINECARTVFDSFGISISLFHTYCAMQYDVLEVEVE